MYSCVLDYCSSLDNDFFLLFVYVLCEAFDFMFETPKLVGFESSFFHNKFIVLKSTSFQDSM